MSSSESDHASKPEEGRPSERPPGRASTIIVDPALMAEAERLTESQRPPAPAHASAEEPAPDHDESEASVDERLSIEDAERFATAFRASWEPPAPAPQSNGNGQRRASQPVIAAASAHAQRTPIAEPQPARVLVSELPGAQRGKTMALGAAAFAGFIIIALLGWLASNSGVPEHPSSDNPLAATPIADKPESKPMEAAPAPVPEPSPAPEPSAAAVVAADPAAADPAAADPAAVADPAAAAADPAAVAAPEAAPGLAAPEAAPAAAPAEPEPVAEQALVALQITTRPQGAQLVLDGAPVANPYDAMHPQGGRHIVEASAPGYRAQNLTIELTRKRRVALELEKDRAAAKVDKADAPRPKRPRAARPKPASSKKGAAFSSESPY